MTVEPDTMSPAPILEDADDFDVFDLLEGMATTSDAAEEIDGEDDVEKVAGLSSVNNEIPNNSDYGASFSQSHSPSTPQVVHGASDHAGTGPGWGKSEICTTSTQHSYSKSGNLCNATNETKTSSGTFFSSCKEKAKEACASVWSNFFSTGTCTTPQKQGEDEEFEHRSRKNRIAGKKAAGSSSSSTRSENNSEAPKKKKPTFKVWKTKVLLDTENNNADKTRNPNPRITDNNIDALRSLESKLLPASYSFEIEKILKKIAKHNYKHIGLQMPDGLIAWAPAIGQILRRFTKVVAQTVDEDGNVLVGQEDLDEKADSDEEDEKELIVSILGDVNFGACCVDDLTAQSLGVEFLVHFGHSCLIPTKQTSVKTMYVHVEVSVNIDHFVNTVEKNFFAPTMLYGNVEDVEDDSTVVCKLPQQQLDRHSSEQDFSSTLSTISSMQDSRYPIIKAGDELVSTAAAAATPGCSAVAPEEEQDLSNPYLDGGEDDDIDSHDDHEGSPHSDANSQISTKASSDCNLTSSPEPTPTKGGGSHSDSEHCQRRGTMTSRTRSSTSQNSGNQREKILFPNPFNRSRLNKRVAILGTVQFATVIDKAKKELQRRIRNTIQNETKTTSDKNSSCTNSSSSHTIPLYALELFTQTQTKPLGKAEVLGCTAPSLLGVDEVIFVCDGRFHLEAVMLRNPQANFYLYNPYSKELTVEKYNYEEMLVQRKQAVNSVKTMVREGVFDRNLYGKAEQGQAEARENKLPLVSPDAGATCGIILGTLGRQGSVAILERLLDVFRKWNKVRERDNSGTENHHSPKPQKIHHVVFLLSEISPQVLHEYEEEVDFWVQIACPRLSLDWGSAFKKPCLTTYECYLVFFDEQKEELEQNNKGDKQDFPQNIFTDIEKRQFEAALGLKQKHISQWNVNSSCCGGGSGGSSGCGSGGCGEIREGEDVEPSCNKEDITSIHDSNQSVVIDAGKNKQSAARIKNDANISLSRYWPEVDYYANAGGPWANYSTAGSQDVKFSHL